MEPRTHLEGEARKELAKKLQQEYYAGASLRQLVKRHGVSYGNVHRLLAEVNTEMRPRGGQRSSRGKARWRG